MQDKSFKNYYWNGLSSSSTSTSITLLLSIPTLLSLLLDDAVDVDVVVVVDVLVDENGSVGTSPPPPEKMSKMLPPIGELRSSMLFLPETLLISVLPSLACKDAPQLKQIDGAGGASSTPLALDLFFMTVTGAPQFGQSPWIVFKDCHTLKLTVATSGRAIANTKNELNIPKTSPPKGEMKNPTTNNSENAPLAISAISFLPPPPPPPPDGGRLYMDRLVVDDDDDDDGFRISCTACKIFLGFDEEKGRF